MKISVSLAREDVATLDEYASAQGGLSRSAAVRAAVRMLRVHRLCLAYEQAWTEWELTGELALWDATSA